MPTSHPRLALVRDPELDAALRRAARVLGPDKPLAAVARELILRGADQITPKDDPFERWLEEIGAERATGDKAQTLAEVRAMPPYDPQDPTPLSDTVDELREDRI
jgi:hypothetical protein